MQNLQPSRKLSEDNKGTMGSTARTLDDATRSKHGANVDTEYFDHVIHRSLGTVASACMWWLESQQWYRAQQQLPRHLMTIFFAFYGVAHGTDPQARGCVVSLSHW